MSSYEWAKDYFREHWDSHYSKWVPYTYYRSKKYTGEYININDSGLRQTKFNRERESSVDVFVFGGSTVYGVGSRDEGTIPSQIAKIASSHGTPVKVQNFGQMGYVSTQGVIELMKLIQRNDIPDIVIFYDGVNDPLASLRSNIGYTLGEDERAQEFNLLNPLYESDSLKTILIRFIYKLEIGRLLYELRNNIRESEGSSNSIARSSVVDIPKIRTSSKSNLAKETFDLYTHNVRVLNSIAREYGFKAYFFWQPIIYSVENLSAEGNQLLNGKIKYNDFYDKVYKHARECSINNFYDISNVLSSKDEDYFIDFCHVNEAANTKIAKKMLEVLFNEGAF
tara:strand:+ start:164 stop:1177 length:1014 start_codon:yes stop_codon:yes gene_type:complete